ncbi:MAG: MoaD/ThiS family protein [Deltaproteobacteria bacterium]|nr:MoaD/ThiS family protein [Deltaproteobacteria bacterium]
MTPSTTCGEPVEPTPVGRNPEREPPAKAGARVEGPVLNVKVVFMGELQRWAGRRELKLELPAGSAIGELAAKLFSLCGETFAQRALTRDGAFQPHVAVFVNGVQIGRLDGSKTVLTGGKVELMLLPMYEGG